MYSVLVPIALVGVCAFGTWNAFIRLTGNSARVVPTHPCPLYLRPQWQTSNLSELVR